MRPKGCRGRKKGYDLLPFRAFILPQPQILPTDDETGQKTVLIAHIVQPGEIKDILVDH
jgi:hypothetical protein